MKGITRRDRSKSGDAANAQVRQNKQDTNTASFADHSARTSNQLQLMNVIHGSASSANQAAQLQRMFGATAQLAGPEEEMQLKAGTAQLAGPEEEMQLKAETAQLAGPEEEMQLKAETAQLAGPEEEMQLKEAGSGSSSQSSNGGLPAGLRAGIEATSGMDLADVRVHSNSDKPRELDALAYTQGNDIHVGPGQERHLPHEAWHVVQQRQGRVSPTVQTKGGVPINDDASLEHEADVMGARAAEAQAGPGRMV
jgi:hypothetical protein